MKERIKLLRKKNKMTQEEFSIKIGLSRNFIAQIESGAKTPSDRTIKDICREFNVSETWIRTGEGEPFLPRTRNQVIADFTADLLREENDSFRRRFIEALSILDINDWKTLEKIAETLIKDQN